MNEAQRGGINAVAESTCRTWAIGKQMAKRAVTMTGPNFCPRHAMADIRVLYDVFTLDRLGETRPARMAVELSIEANSGSPDTTST